MSSLSASLGGRRQRRLQRRRLIGRITELIVSFPLTPKHTGGVRRNVYAARGTAAHLKHGFGIEGDGIGDKCVKTEGWRAVARMITSFTRNLWSSLEVGLVLLYVEMHFGISELC